MKWIVMNGLGAAVWIAGLSLAKGNTLPDSVATAVGDHNLTVGLTLGLVALVFLLWTNLRSTA